jgi:methionyl-tRNA synthetase
VPPPAANESPAIAAAAIEDVLDRYEALDFGGALTEVWKHVGAANQAIVTAAPWNLAKEPARRGELEGFLYRLIESVRLIAVLVSPVMPRAAGRILGMLGIAGAELGPGDLRWGGLKPGALLGEISALFPRIEKETATATNSGLATGKKKGKALSEGATSKPEAAVAPQPTTAGAPGTIDISAFAALDLRVAQIIEAVKIEGSKKLVKLQVDLGTEKRQVVAGIAEAYAPEALVGRKVVLVANLKPAKLMGVESNGMVLAASIDGKAVLCGFDQDVPPGTKVK